MYTGIYLVAVLIASVSQILLKKSAQKKYPSPWREYLNRYVLCAYGLLFLSMFLTVFAYRQVDLKTGPVLEAFSYICVAALGVIFLQEKLSRGKKLGLCIIVIGIIVFYL